MADNYSIVVTVNGDTGRSSNNGIKTQRMTQGEYVVTFPENITSWLWLATIGPTDDTAQDPSFVTTELQTMTQNAVRVRTSDQNANPADRAFHLHVRRIH